MSLVNLEMSFTFQPGNNQWSKVTIGVQAVNTELPLDEQLSDISNTVDGVWEYVRNQVDAKVEQIFEEANSGAN
jgi:hypothetical protein